MKRCCTCKQYKPISEFYRDRSKSDGYQALCKDCCRAYSRTEARKASQKKYDQSAKGRRARQKYTKSPKGREAQCNRAARQGKDHPKQIKAKNFLNRAVQSGQIHRPQECVICGKRAKLHGHHHKGYAEENYLNVLWLCPKCHTQVHREKACKTGKEV